MPENILRWASANYIELFGAITGIIYIFLSVKQHIFTWPVGLVSSVFYIVVFLQAGVYAMMLLQVYYFGMSLYGWYFWKFGPKSGLGNHTQVTTLAKKSIVKLTGISVLAWGAIYFLLIRYTDTNVPLADSFTTSMSLVATWMLARKYLENWIVWIVVDTVCTMLFISKALWPTVILYLVYTVMAILGYQQWKKDLKPVAHV